MFNRSFIITIIVVAITAITTISFVWADTDNNKPATTNPFLNRVAELVEVDPVKLREAFAQAKRELKPGTTITNGRPTREEAALKLQELKKKPPFHHMGKPNWEQLNHKIQAAVESGELTREEAALKLKELKKPRHLTTEDVKARMQSAVESGTVTQEQADERLEAWKKERTKKPKGRLQ